jgi:PAS domain S-box-containing protein
VIGSDVTELRAARDRLEFLISSTPAVIYTCKPYGDYAITFVNPSVTSQLGYSAEELTKDSQFWVNHLHPDDRQRVLDGFASLYKEGRHVYEYRLRHKDGTYRRIRDEMKLIRDESSNPVEVAGCMIDVTKPDLIDGGRRKYGLSVWKRAEHLEDAVEYRTREVIESEKKFREFANLLPQMAFETDETCRLTFVNRNVFTMLGYTQDDLDKGLSISQVVTPEDQDRLKDHMLNALKRETYFAESERRVRGKEYTMLRKNGSTFPAVFYSNPIFRENKAVGVRGIAVDITDLKRTEEELMESRERLSTIIQASPEGIIVTSLKGYIVDCNQAALQLHHCSFNDQLIGRDVTELIAKKDQELAAETFRRLSGLGSVKDVECTLVTRDGREFPGEFSASIVRNAAGSPIAYVAVVKDLTEHNQIQERLRRSERMAAIGETAAMVGHDLRNPLQGISGAAYVLKQKLGSNGDAESAEMFSLIDTGLKYADNIVKELLDYSKEIHVELSETTPNVVIEAALRQVKIPENITIRNLTQNTPRLLIDAAKMQRVFVNLVNNAIDAMPKGGELSITNTESNEILEFRFADTGEGISDDAMANLWKPFKTTKSTGMGLGLAISKRIVEAHGGFIQAESILGEGSTFTVKLPIRNKTETIIAQ